MLRSQPVPDRASPCLGDILRGVGDVAPRRGEATWGDAPYASMLPRAGEMLRPLAERTAAPQVLGGNGGDSGPAASGTRCEREGPGTQHPPPTLPPALALAPPLLPWDSLPSLPSAPGGGARTIGALPGAHWEWVPAMALPSPKHGDFGAASNAAGGSGCEIEVAGTSGSLEALTLPECERI